VHSRERQEIHQVLVSVHYDGKTESAEHYENPIITKSGEETIIGTLSSGTDITEIIRYREVLKASEERYRLAQRAAHMGSWDRNLLTGDLYWSDQIGDMFGFGSDQFGGAYEASLDFIHPEDRERVMDRVSA